MHLVYIDDSADERLAVFSALAIPVEQWRAAFTLVKQFRHDLKVRDGIRVQEELHAWKFLAGKGDISNRIVPKGRRAEIFRETLRLTATLPGALSLNVVAPKSKPEQAFEWLLNRINVCMQKLGSHALLICDEGKNDQFTRMARRMSVFNPIPSRYGSWGSGGYTTNKPIDRIIEDPIFKRSDRSYFIQLADTCAFALLRQERPTDRITKYNLERAFTLLDPIVVHAANTRDPLGIIRVS